MKWMEIRKQYPDKWVLVEATSAYSKDNKRILEELSVLEVHPSSNVAWNAYKQIHCRYPDIELYILHTSREQIEVIEQRLVSPRRRA